MPSSLSPERRTLAREPRTQQRLWVKVPNAKLGNRHNSLSRPRVRQPRAAAIQKDRFMIAGAITAGVIAIMLGMCGLRLQFA